MKIITYVEKIKDIARRARSEAKLEVELTPVFRKCFLQFGIKYDPAINETLRSLGLSQIDADRPDGVFGHIVYDYKSPNLLSVPSKLIKSKKQIEKYLEIITGGHLANPEKCALWFAYLFDGYSFVFCQSDGSKWKWSDRIPVSKNSLLFLVHAYRALKRKPLTALLLSTALGKDSTVARELIRVMCSHLAKPRHMTNMLFREWRRLFEQVSTYGLDQLPSLKTWAAENGIATKDASHILFAMHTYYSVVVKLLTSELLAVLVNGPSICQALATAPSIKEIYSVLRSLEDSEHYKRFRITNFLEGDFFSWYLDEESKPLADAIRALANEFTDFEPSTAYLKPLIIKDLLKEFYSSLVDEQVRHDLGEYYTPDWLAQHLLDRVGYKGNPEVAVLDPTCGSGTFLVECIIRLKKRCFETGFSRIETLKTILKCIKGLDLNPLAVISSRANYIFSISDLVFALGYDIEIPVYLADSINVPIERTDTNGVNFLEYFLDTEVEKIKIQLPLNLVRGQVLGRVLLYCEDCITQKKKLESFLRMLEKEKDIAFYLNDDVIAYLSSFYKTIESLEKRDWDKIWCRILKNNFSPKGFALSDLVVGNPPWVRWSRLPETYRNRVKEFCNYYGLVSGRGYSGGIESDISTVITYSAVDNWLKTGGKIGFLITWTVFKSDSARGFRLSKLPNGKGLKILLMEDLTLIQPFPDATNQTAIYVAKKVDDHKKAELKQIPCYVWQPRNRTSRISPSVSLNKIDDLIDIKLGVARPIADWGSPLFTGDIKHFDSASFLKGKSPYLENAHRGTISDCARVYWVKVLRYSEVTNRVMIRTLTEEELAKARLVSPVSGAWIEADLLYPLLRGRDVGRYCHRSEGWHQIIPNKHYEDVESEEDFADKYPLTYSYFKNYEDLLKNRSTYKRYQSHLPFYVIYCVGAYAFAPYKVVWMEQQDPAEFRACVISSDPDSITPNKIIVPDHKLYLADFKYPQEAHYLCGFLNSRPVRTWLSGFLLGKQIGTTIFEYMNVLKYNPRSSECKKIAEISKKEHKRRGKSTKIDYVDDSKENSLEALVKRLFLNS